MKMLLIPVPEEYDPGTGGADTIRETIQREGFALHEVELPGIFDMRADLENPKFGLQLSYVNLQLLGIALNAFTDALAKDRELDT